MRTVTFNGIALGELNVDFLSTPSKVVAKAAFINTQTGATHGWTTCHQWAPDTMERLRELRALMERDLAAIHFADASGVQPLTSTTRSGGLQSEMKGLGERLGAPVEEVPQG